MTTLSRARFALLAAVITALPIPLFADDAPATSTAPAPEILTPAAPHTPRINGARIFGVHPNSPFLFTIPATGDRPMTFAADKLPTGLFLDVNTGQITGTIQNWKKATTPVAPGDPAIAEQNEFTVTFHATNSLGTDTKPFKIVVGDTIALTPPMGWNSWNCWASAVDQEKVLASAKAMVDKGLINHGWTYINIDDTWQGARGGDFHAIMPNEKFPDMKALTDQIHAMGLKAGIYSTPWRTSYARHIGGSADDAAGTWTKPESTTKPHNQENGPWVIGKVHFATNDAKQWGVWGFDYLKYDWNPNKLPETQEMEDALNASGRDIVYSLSNSTPFPTIDDISKHSNLWRTTGDIRDTWWSLTGNGFSQAKWAPQTRPGHWNDPDMLILGYVGWGPKLHSTQLTPDEQYTHISLWCLLSSPLLIGCDMTRLDDFTLSLLTNDEVLAVDQDPAGKPAELLTKDGDTNEVSRADRNGPGGRTTHKILNKQIWAKPLSDGSVAVGLFNTTDKPTDLILNLADLHLTGPQTIRDLWRQKDLTTTSDTYTTTVNPHGVVFVKLTPAK